MVELAVKLSAVDTAMMMRNHGWKKEADGERIRIKCR